MCNIYATHRYAASVCHNRVNTISPDMMMKQVMKGKMVMLTITLMIDDVYDIREILTPNTEYLQFWWVSNL